MENRNTMSLSFSKICSVARTEYIKWICNPRMIIILCMMIFVYDYIICIMEKASDEMGHVCMIFEPFLAIGNSALLLLIMPIVFISLMGDFPKTDGNTLFYIQRTGKKNWLIGQVMFAIMADITFIIIVFVMSVVFAYPFSKNMGIWSEVVTKYVYFFPERYGDFMANLLTNRLYNNLTPYKALFYTVTLMFLYLLLVAIILLTGFSMGKRIIGIAVDAVVMCVGSGLIYSDSIIKWIFPAANSICWVHFDKIMKKQIFDIRYSYLYFVVLIVVLILIDMVSINHYDFAKITDMED